MQSRRLLGTLARTQEVSGAKGADDVPDGGRVVG